MKARKVIFSILILSGVFLLVVGAIFLNKVIAINSSLKLDTDSLVEATSRIDIFDLNNDLLNANSGKKALIKLEDMPDYIPASFISIEDKNFYTHNGLNYKRMVKAMLNNLKSGSLKEGASTISQQLIKNTHLTHEKTLDRKIKEILLVKQLEKQFSKKEILETYLNVIYFGNGSYGIENASHNYFDKSANELTLAESSMLAGLIKSPRTYSPVFNVENCLKRRNLVLSEMLKDKKISKEQFDNASSEKIKISANASVSKNKNYYEQAVLNEACKILNLSEKDLALSGYKIFSFYDKQLEDNLEEKLNDNSYYHKNSYGNTADSVGVVLDNETGGVNAFYGKSNYDIINMKRSPGSAIKPVLVYAPALETGKISPETPILDEKTTFADYSPHNVGDHYYGWISARKTIEKSLNVPAIKIMQYAGIDNCKKMASNCGINFDKTDNNYAIALGAITNGTTVLELTNSYIPFSQNGVFKKAGFVKKICDKNGHLIYEKDTNGKQVMSSETAYLLTDMLVSSAKTGTSMKLNSLPFQIAGKTGTVGLKGTNNNSDVWSVAYTKNKTVGVWLGNSTNAKEFELEGKNNGGTYCTAIVRDVFDEINTTKPQQKFDVPSKIVTTELDSLELENNHILKLASDKEPSIYKTTAIFNEKYLPKEKSQKFDKAEICKISAELIGSKPKITFNAISYLQYKIYRVEEDKTKLLKIIKNTSGKFEFLDETTDEATLYTYYVESYVADKDGKTLNSVKSNDLKVFTPMPKLNAKNVEINRSFMFS